tara:strand:+ start:600 stop:770 length:171 start_codon:yes stop_codon:yes gene_type:complete
MKIDTKTPLTQIEQDMALLIEQLEKRLVRETSGLRGYVIDLENRVRLLECYRKLDR